MLIKQVIVLSRLFSSFLLLVTTLLVAMGVYLTFIVYNSTEYVETWANNQQTSIEQGNLFHALSSLEREVGDSSDFIGLRFVKQNENKITDLAAFGQFFLIDINDLKDLNQNISYEISGIYKIKVFFRFSHSKNLKLVFLFSYVGVFYFALLVWVVINFLSFLGYSVFHLVAKKEEQRRIELVSLVFSTLLENESVEYAEVPKGFGKNWVSISKTFERLKEELSTAAANRSIVQTTQMLAHDVRKPFSMIKALISLINEQASAEEVKIILNENIPIVSRAISSVEAMIQDVMEIGSASDLMIERIPIDQLIHQNLQSVFQFRSDLDIQLSYDFEKNFITLVDLNKYNRVIGNILSNAIEHMNGTGKIWFRAKIDDNSFMSFSIGNSDTHIPEEDQTKLFDAFYTKGKKGGTGLGLAIVKKIVESHGGSIQCRSSKIFGTEFSLKIPIDPTESNDTIDLPLHSQTLKANDSAIVTEKQRDAPKLTDNVKNGISKVFIIDDENIYIDTIASQIKNLQIAAKIFRFNDHSNLYQSIHIEKPHLIILDVDLKLGSLNGFDICRRIREKGYTGILCIHSNRGLLEYQPKAIEAGADYFLPKPVSRTELLLLLQKCGELKETAQKKQILVFEDEAIFRRQWKRAAGNRNIQTFENWNDFHN